MEKNREVFQTIKTEEVKSKIIQKFVLLMLSRRIYIDNEGNKQKLLDIDNIDMPELTLDKTFIVTANTGHKYITRIFFQKLTSSGKQSVISDFIKEYPTDKKIIIASDFTGKIKDFCSKNGIQLFKEDHMLQDIIVSKEQPAKFELLSPSEMKRIKDESGLNNYVIDKTEKDEIIVRYFAIGRGDIYRVERFSQTSGYCVAYRIVK